MNFALQSHDSCKDGATTVVRCVSLTIVETEELSSLPSVTDDTCVAAQGGMPRWNFFPRDGTSRHGGTYFLTPQALILLTGLFDANNTFSSSYIRHSWFIQSSPGISEGFNICSIWKIL